MLISISANCVFNRFLNNFGNIVYNELILQLKERSRHTEWVTETKSSNEVLVCIFSYFYLECFLCFFITFTWNFMDIKCEFMTFSGYGKIVSIWIKIVWSIKRIKDNISLNTLYILMLRTSSRSSILKFLFKPSFCGLLLV